MTKSVRVENADTSSYKVHVFYEDKQSDGSWARAPAQTKADFELNFPTAMALAGIHASRRLVVEEVS